jgi:pimeloyl-ACP methyl ester carboxylesterase
VTLVGSDTGGGLCQLVVDAYPDRIGRLVLTNCDAFDKCPPFPFDMVFGLLRGPISIKALFGQLRLRALRHSPLGFGLLVNQPDPQLTAAWLQPCLNDSRICRDLAALPAYRDSPSRSHWYGASGTAALPRTSADAWPDCSATGS